MSGNNHLLHATVELTKALNHAVDDNFPQKLADLVKLHATIAVGSAFLPVPGADIAAAAANVWTMYVRINREIGLPLSENLIRSIATGVATNLGAAAATFLVAGSILKIIPGIGSLGGAVVMGATIYAVTVGSGIVYFKAISKLLSSKNGSSFTEADIKAAADDIMRDKKTMKSIIEEGRASYKHRATE